MYKNIIAALHLMLKGSYNKDNPMETFREFGLGKQLFTVQKGDTIIQRMDPAKDLYFLLSGRTIILNQISWSIDDVIDYVEPPHILGLSEYLDNMPNYTAYVVAAARCVLFRIPVSDFIRLIRQDPEMCYNTLYITARLASSHMRRAETHRIFPKKDIFGHYLYQQALHKLPYKCPLTRKDLAEHLNINLRSLYRYIDYMAKEGYLFLEKGKITVKKEQLEKLSERYGDVIL